MIFDIRNKKDFEILEALKQFGGNLLEVKQEEQDHEFKLIFAFYA